MDDLRTKLADINITCFAEIYKNMREIGKAEKGLIQNVVVLCNLLMINPVTAIQKDLFQS